MQCWVYGNSLENSLVAVVVPDKDAVLALCKKKNIAAPDLTTGCQDESIQSTILKDVRECCVGAGLRGYALFVHTYMHKCMHAYERNRQAGRQTDRHTHTNTVSWWRAVEAREEKVSPQKHMNVRSSPR